MTEYNVIKSEKDLVIGDVIKLSDGAHMAATIIKIRQNDDGLCRWLTLFRPYTHTSDVETSGGIIPYIGFEQFEISDSQDGQVYCYESNVGIK